MESQLSWKIDLGHRQPVAMPTKGFRDEGCWQGIIACFYLRRWLVPDVGSTAFEQIEGLPVPGILLEA